MKPEKILCIQLRQIGDVLMTTPAVRELKTAFPNAEIHYLTETPSNQIFEFSPYISKIIKFPKQGGTKELLQLIGELRRENYQLVIDFFGIPKTAIIARLTGAATRIGFKKRYRSFFYTHALETPADIKYSALQKLNFLTTLGINSNNAQLDFFVGEDDRKVAKDILKEVGVTDKEPVITVSPVSRRDYKVWPAENFAAVCDHLVQEYQAQILFLWGPGEYHFIEAVRNKMKEKSLPDYDIPTIRETVALFEEADFHLGNDNGPMHFAIAARCPSLGIFGRPLSINWMPPQSKKHQAVESDPGCKNSCHYPECKLECLTLSTPEMVIERLEQQFNDLRETKEISF